MVIVNKRFNAFLLRKNKETFNVNFKSRIKTREKFIWRKSVFNFNEVIINSVEWLIPKDRF